MASKRIASHRCLAHLRPSDFLRPAARRTLPSNRSYPSLARRHQSSVAPRDSTLPAPAAGGVPPPAPPPYRIPREIGPGVLEGDNTRVLLRQNNLFHAWDKSPSAAIRERAARIKLNAYCPHAEHQHVGELTHIKFTCPDCGIPAYCSEDHWAEDYENHLLICDTLKEANEDEHDLRSGRFFPEFEHPGEQIEEQLVNMTNWDTFMYTRGALAIDGDRQMRQATKLLTYPTTIASVIHELSPYSLRHRLTNEGLRSFSGNIASP